MTKKILIADDEFVIRELLKDMLEEFDFEITEAENGREAVEKAQVIKPDLMILDLTMPFMGGLEACEVLRKNEETKSIPIIILTVKAKEADKISGLEIGADDYITKPFKKGELIARVNAVLRRLELRKDDPEA
ncbi:response regulator transcription factor [Elusimicrobiota bacterium]